MIKIRFEIQNPWSRNRFKNLGSINGHITKNKHWELEHTLYDGLLLDFNFEITTNRDHAGLDLVIGVMTYSIHFSIYDVRHWDYGRGCYINHD